MRYTCPRCNSQNAGGSCAACGYHSQGNAFGAMMDDMRSGTAPARERTPIEKDSSFANILGVVAAASVLWSGLRRGAITDAYLVATVLTGVGVAYALRRMPWLVRPLRWIASAVAVCAIAAVLLFLLRAMR